MGSKQDLVVDLVTPHVYTGPYEGKERLGDGRVKYVVRERFSSFWDTLPVKGSGKKKTHFSFDEHRDVVMMEDEDGRTIRYIVPNSDVPEVDFERTPIGRILEQMKENLERQDDKVQELKRERNRWKRKYKNLKDKMDGDEQDSSQQQEDRVQCPGCDRRPTVSEVEEEMGYCPHCNEDLAGKEKVNVNA